MTKNSAITADEARKWVESRAWANGWNAVADETIDAVEFATQYEANKPLWDKHFKFLAETDPKTLQPGKIVLEEGRLWLNILEYTPKSAEDTKIESHENFIDLQYTYEGNEIMGLAHHVIPTGDYDPVKTRPTIAPTSLSTTSPPTPTASSFISPPTCTSPRSAQRKIPACHTKSSVRSNTRNNPSASQTIKLRQSARFIPQPGGLLFFISLSQYHNIL